jgi:hypothetical protein
MHQKTGGVQEKTGDRIRGLKQRNNGLPLGA